MKVRLVKPDSEEAQVSRHLRSLSQAYDPATGERRRWESRDALKAQCRIEEVVASLLEQEPTEHRGELRFHCLPKWHGGPDNHPSLWLNVDKQRFGCNVCGIRGLGSGDVIDFVQRFYDDSNSRDAEAWLRSWARSHRPRITIRLRKRSNGQ